MKLIFFSPDVRAFLQMDSPKHQSDPSEDEDERSTQKVVQGINCIFNRKKYHFTKIKFLSNIYSNVTK
jgi:hypothetical protein